ncbi:MAG: Gfo/Idh/MocA family oxidoreductase [Chthoniobacteraceae bacterium]|nr:Gfo/Idh/MocA family oxidoreductase [Chthoniobacteraceae bacterium]
MIPKTTQSRRRFIQASSLSLGALFFPHILRGQAPKKLQLAGIGVGGKGKVDILNASMGAEIAALCDVDRSRLEAAKALYPNARTFESFREMFEVMGNTIDAVTVSTPDHSHFPAAMEAIRRGKHVCVQKPLVNRVWEASQLLAAAREKGVVTNMGNQGHLLDGIRQLKEYLELGIIGRVKEIHVWTNRPIWPQGGKARDGMVAAIAPATLNWEAWLAQCPAGEYLPGLHPFAWRAHREYGSGAIGDMGCHTLDGPFYACELGDPYRLQADVEDLTDLTFPTSSNITMWHKTRLFGEVKVIWYDGSRKPERPAELDESEDWSKAKAGALYIGEEGKLICIGDHARTPRLLPYAKHEDWLAKKMPQPTIERATAKNPQIEFVEAVLAGGKCGSNFEYAVPLTRYGLLGNIAVQNPGKELEWDAATQHFKNSPEANLLLKRPSVKKGWESFA